MFDVTVYTDVRADEALDGIAGFNFLAESPGITGADRHFIAQRMLHIVKSSWHVDHADELAHPPTCIFRTAGGRHYLSRGVSTGKTVTAPRPGNQLTQTIVTGDVDDFIPYRPAQLYSASQWNLTRETAGKQLSAWPTPLEIDAGYEPSELKADLVERSPFGTTFLPQYLTMVEQSLADPGKKLIIVHTDLDLVMRYIALASLFVDFRRALDMSFVAFADQPLAMVANIVGATPDFGSTPAAGTGATAYNVVDLLAVQMTAVEVSESAARQSQWFSGGDPLDALAAIDVARRWEAYLGATVATDAAGIVSFTDGPVAAPRDRAAALQAIVGLSAGGLDEDIAMYSDELLDAVATSPPGSGADIDLAAGAIEAARRVNLDEVAAGVLLPTLEILASRSELIPNWSAAVSAWTPGSAPLSWEAEESRVHALQTQAEVINSSRGEDIARVLVAAHICGLLPEESAVGTALDRLADYWSNHPELSHLREDLPYQSGMGPRLVNRLLGGLEHNDGRIVDSFVAGQWDWIVKVSPVLRPWQTAAEVGAMSPDSRAQAVEIRGAQLPLAGWRIVFAGVDFPACTAVVAKWVETHPNIPADLGSWILAGLTEAQGDEAKARTATKVVNSLLDNRATSADPGLTRLIAEISTLDRIYQDAKDALRSKRNPHLKEYADRIGPYIGFFVEDAGNLLVRAQDQSGIERLERAIGDWAPLCINRWLHGIARRGGDADAVERALSLQESGTKVQRSAGLDFLISLMDTRQGRQRLDTARKDLAPSWVPVLDELIEESKKGRLTRNLMRGGKRLFGREG